jgi:zinc transporter, ZIP family
VTPDVAGRTQEAAPIGRRDRPTVATWLLALIPVFLLAGLLVWIVKSGPAESVRGEGYPPVERLTFQRVVLDGDGVLVRVLNDGPDPVTIAQVQIDDAFWTFTSDRAEPLEHLERATLRIPYPWVQGEAHHIRLLTSTGTPFEHEVPVAVATPTITRRFVATFTLIGLYVGVIPVAIGLLWFPLLRRLSAGGMDFVLALTIGLLMFLLLDGTHEGLEASNTLPASFQGFVLFVTAAGVAYLGLELLGAWLSRRRANTGEAGTLSLLIAFGIGLHNLAEGLAIGAAFALGEAGLGTLLIIGFTLHNTTEGLAIVAPIIRRGESLGIGKLLQLGLIGGVPTIAGAWIGGFAYSPLWAVLFLGAGVGAIGQVVGQIWKQLGRHRAVPALSSGPVLGGLAAGFAVMYITGMLVG